MGNQHFAKFPQINLPRSRFKIDFTHKLAMLHGFLTPIDCREILPGDSFDAKKIASLVHMSTPIVPFMDNIDMYVRCFFVPTRLLWENFENFMGANKGAGYQTVIPVFPACNIGTVKTGTPKQAKDLTLNLSHLLGKPVQTFGVGTKRVLPKALSVLKERGYFLIWNNYFRAEQLQAEYPVDISDGVVSGTDVDAKVLLTDDTSSASTYDVWNHDLLKVNKKHDYFSSCTLSPQYGAAVTLPLGTTANIVADSTVHDMGNTMRLGHTGSTYSGDVLPYLVFPSAGASTGFGMLDSSGYNPGGVGDTINSSNLVADLSNATAATINSLRYAFAVQRYLERSNYGSNHFYEILAVHYGVTSPDARLQRPEYLGGFHYRINVDQVLNSTGKTDTDQTDLGKKGAVSVTADRHFGFTKGFVEPGYLYVLAYTKQDRTYSSLVLKEDMKTNRFEFYSPEFANIGDQEVLRFEIDGSFTSDSVFGYQEAWSEYRFAPSRCSGYMNPDLTGSMPYWSLADSYGAVPQLGSSWIEEDRAAVARALVTGVNGPDFLCDWYIEYTAARLMPVYSIPGLIDHVGSM